MRVAGNSLLRSSLSCVWAVLFAAVGRHWYTTMFAAIHVIHHICNVSILKNNI